jgi:hypothetical protein
MRRNSVSLPIETLKPSESSFIGCTLCLRSGERRGAHASVVSVSADDAV